MQEFLIWEEEIVVEVVGVDEKIVVVVLKEEIVVVVAGDEEIAVVVVDKKIVMVIQRQCSSSPTCFQPFSPSSVQLSDNETNWVCLLSRCRRK